MRGVIDTSVALKWFVVEDDHDRAKALIGQPLIAPDWMIAELANTVWKKFRAGEMTREQAGLAQSFARSFVDVTSSIELVDRALAMAIELGHPVYDCVFLALSEVTGAPLITADAKFLKRCAGSPFERYLEPL